MATPSDERAFLRGIRAAPDDDTPRLAFADWLEEHGRAVAAEFVRVQCELEPVRGRYDLPGVYEREQREKRLLARREVRRWLRGQNKLPERDTGPEWLGFRRGVVEVARLSLDELLEHGETVLRLFPTVRELVVYNVRGRGRDLAGAPALARIDTLEVADWITAADANHFLGYPGRQVGTARVWVGHPDDESVCLGLIRSRDMLGLRTVELVQLYGGLAAGDAARDLDRRTQRLVRLLQGWGLASRVVRPYEQLFPLRGDVGYGVHAGRLRGRTPVVLIDPQDDSVDEVGVFTFHRGGKLLRARDRTLPPARPRERWMGRVRRGLGFEPGLIAVREFRDPDRGFGVYLFDHMHHDLLADPDAEGPGRAEEVEGIVWWLEVGNFVVDRGGWMGYWADRDGDIHTS